MQVSSYQRLDNYNNVFCNNFTVVDGRYRFWKMVHNYETGQSVRENIPLKLKSTKFTPLFRFYPYEYLRDNVNDDSLVFSEPSLWNDPYEKAFYKTDIAGKPVGVEIEGRRIYVACMCFTYDPIEAEEAAWQRSDPGSVRVEFSMEKLCEQLTHHLECQFYFSVADYSMSRKDISKLASKKKSGIYSSIDEYLNCMSLKRKAFSYENEIRLFLVSEQEIDFVKGRYPVHCSMMECIQSVCLPPKDPRPVLDEKRAKAELQISNIMQSRLYEL